MARTGNRVKLTTPLSDKFGWVIYVVSMLSLLSIAQPRLHFTAFVSLLTVATGAYLWNSAKLFEKKTTLNSLKPLLFIGLALRIYGILLEPGFSEDIFRYIYEGRVVWHMGLDFPFLVSPSEAISRGIPVHLVDENFLRINHPKIPTIYPPAAQTVFIAFGGISEGLRWAGFGPYPWMDLLMLKVILVAFELGSYLIIAWAIQSYNRNQGKAGQINMAWIVVLLTCPLSTIEIAREGHADSVAMFGLAMGVAGFTAARWSWGHFGWSFAALAKLTGLIGLAVGFRSTRKGVWPAIVILIIFGAPYLALSMDSGRGLSEYATRWRSFDGAFSILLWLSKNFLGGDWVRLGEITITHQQLARLFFVTLFGTIVLFQLRRPIQKNQVATLTGELTLILLLLNPTLHPWYISWLLPFLPFCPRIKLSALWLLCVSPLTHHATHSMATSGVWNEPIWLRLVIHLPAWLFLMIGYRQSRATQRDPSDRLQE